MGRLEGRRAFLTAAGAGIGRATAEAFAREGAEVIATDVDRRKLDGLEAAGVARLEELNVLETDAVNALAVSVGQIDVLFNCAGFVHHGTVLECSEKDWDFSFDLNVKSMHRMITAFLPGMLERSEERGKPGAIVNVSSGASSIRGIPNRYVYGATKAAVIGLTKAVAADFIKRGVRCNAIAPGTVLSPSLESRVAALAVDTGESEEKVWEAFIARQPMGRLGTAEEMAAVAVFLASDESAFTTGIVVSADGGFSL
jgi:2-keto-3-deoxy-L-fuconate dehydrogenase